MTSGSGGVELTRRCRGPVPSVRCQEHVSICRGKLGIQGELCKDTNVEWCMVIGQCYGNSAQRHQIVGSFRRWRWRDVRLRAVQNSPMLRFVDCRYVVGVGHASQRKLEAEFAIQGRLPCESP